MSGVPDYTLEATLDFKFTTRQFSTGAPFAFAGGVIEIYEDNDIAQITGAETLTLEFDGVTGLHNLRVAATAANGFENGKSYHCVVSAGTVDGVSVIGEVVQQFSIGRSAAAEDLANGTDGLSALNTLLLDIPTVSEFNARTILSASYFDPAVDAVIVGTMNANVLNAAAIAAAALDGKGDWNIGKTGYSLTQVFPTNFADLAITLTTGLVTLAAVTHTGAVIPTVSVLTGHTAQTGDSFARIGAAGASLTDLGGMSTGMKAEILVEVNAALDASISELAQLQPTATPSIRTGLMLMYMALRNKLDVQTSGVDALEIHNAAGTMIARKLLTDAGGDYSEALMVAGV